MASDIQLRTILIVRKETRCCHIGYSFRLTARVLLYAPSHRQDSTYHSLCYTSRGTLAGTRNSPMGPPWRIYPTTHHTMSEHCYHVATSRCPIKTDASMLLNKYNIFIVIINPLQCHVAPLVYLVTGWYKPQSVCIISKHEALWQSHHTEGQGHPPWVADQLHCACQSDSPEIQQQLNITHSDSAGQC